MSIEAVEYVLQRLAATYGAEWDRAIGRAPINDVKSVWLNAIGGFTQSNDAKRAIMWALDNLPERAPNAIQFRNLCLKAPAIEQKRLAPPPADPAIVADALAKISAMTAKKPAQGYDHKAWAKRIMQRVTDGELVNPTSARMAREALRLDRETA